MPTIIKHHPLVNTACIVMIVSALIVSRFLTEFRWSLKVLETAIVTTETSAIATTSTTSSTPTNDTPVANPQPQPKSLSRMDPQYPTTTIQPCCSWLTNTNTNSADDRRRHRRRRQVLFISLPSLDEFVHKGGTRQGGEAYMGASMDWAVRQLGFDVVHIEGWEKLEKVLMLKNKKKKKKRHSQQNMNNDDNDDEPNYFHRVFYNGVSETYRFDDFQMDRCRLRPIEYFNQATRAANEHGLEVQQILEPYASDRGGTFMGYFLHGLVGDGSNDNKHSHSHNNGNSNGKSIKKQPTPAIVPTLLNLTRANSHKTNNSTNTTTPTQPYKPICLLGKYKQYFMTARPILKALVENGFTLHSTCHQCARPKHFFGPPRLIQSSIHIHHTLTPDSYMTLLSHCLALIGFGQPTIITIAATIAIPLLPILRILPYGFCRTDSTVGILWIIEIDIGRSNSQQGIVLCPPTIIDRIEKGGSDRPCEKWRW